MKRNAEGIIASILLIMIVVLFAPENAPAGEAPEKWLSPGEIKQSALKAIFEKEENWQVERINDGLKVTDNDGHLAVVLWDEEKELICYVMYYGFKPGVSAKKKRKLANEINDSVVFTKAMIDQDGDLRFEYWLRVGAGLSEGQITDSIKYFIKISTGALQWKDSKDLVQ